MSQHLLPEILADEDCEVFWALGHVHPMLFLLAVLPELGSVHGDAEAMRAVFGKHDWGTNEFAATAESVRYVWLVEDPENEENMLPATRETPEAREYTRWDYEAAS